MDMSNIFGGSLAALNIFDSPFFGGGHGGASAAQHARSSDMGIRLSITLEELQQGVTDISRITSFYL